MARAPDLQDDSARVTAAQPYSKLGTVGHGHVHQIASAANRTYTPPSQAHSASTG